MSYMIYKHVYILSQIKFHIPCSNSSLVITVKLKASKQARKEKRKKKGCHIVSHSTEKFTLIEVAYFSKIYYCVPYKEPILSSAGQTSTTLFFLMVVN
jgi:hypothetical protein